MPSDTLLEACPYFRSCPARLLLGFAEEYSGRRVLECAFFKEKVRELLYFLYRRLGEGEEFDAILFRVKRTERGLEVAWSGR